MAYFFHVFFLTNMLNYSNRSISYRKLQKGVIPCLITTHSKTPIIIQNEAAV